MWQKVYILYSFRGISGRVGTRVPIDVQNSFSGHGQAFISKKDIKEEKECDVT